MASWTAGLDALVQDRSLVHVGVILVALIDATGLPFPGRAMMVAAGAAGARDWWDVASLSGAGALGCALGDHLWYAAGRLGAGARLTRLYCRLSLASARCEERTGSRFERFGPLAIVIGRFVAGVRFVVTPMVAAGALAYPRYLVYELIGCLAWSGLFVGLGYALGVPWREHRDGMNAILIALAALTVLGPAAIVAVRLGRRRRHGPAGSARG